MGAKKKKKQYHSGAAGNGPAIRRDTATATLNRELNRLNLDAAAGEAWSSKYGNSEGSEQKAVAAGLPNSLELPNPGNIPGGAPAIHPNHFLPQNDSAAVEQETVAKKQDSKRNSMVAPAEPPSTPPPLPSPPPPSASKGGFLKRLFGSSAKPASANEPDDPTGPLITLFSGRVKLDAAKVEAAKAESAKPAEPAAKSGEPAPRMTAVGEDILQKLGELERLREENSTLKRKLEEERQSARRQFGQLEIQNNELSSAAGKARAEKADVDARTAVLRKSVTALERQMGEERERFNQELGQARKQSETLLEEVATLNEKCAKLEAEFDALSSSSARSTVTGLSTEIGASHAHISRLESLVQRLEDEVELLQRELSTEKERYRRGNDEWEEKLRKNEQTASHAAAERSRIEDSAVMVQAAIDALEQQVREQHEAMEVQMKLLDSERAQSRAKSGEYEQKLKALQAQLDAEMSRHLPEDDADATLTKMETALTETRTHSTQVEARIAMLEGELEAARNQVMKEAEASAARIKKFEARWQDIQQQTLPKDTEMETLRPQVKELKAQITSLEAELKSAKAAVARLAASAGGDGSIKPVGSKGDPTFAQAGVRLPADVAEPFYHQSMAPITVMLACADILGMSRKLDPTLKSTADEIRQQTQLLLDLIKSYTLPPEAKSN